MAVRPCHLDELPPRDRAALARLGGAAELHRHAERSYLPAVVQYHTDLYRRVGLLQVLDRARSGAGAAQRAALEERAYRPHSGALYRARGGGRRDVALPLQPAGRWVECVARRAA